MKQYKAEEAKPNPRSTINSYRSFGYNLPTAIADIIDNSISGKATDIWIDYVWKGKDSYIIISDNGIGMSLLDLVSAMTPGSKDPENLRSEDDLGRFGMGLKTASFSQCKRLTVCAKKDRVTFKRCWDIDFINEEEEWFLLDYISDEALSHRLNIQNNGTVVIWEKLDRIVGASEAQNETVKNAFYNEFNLVEDHISMVFHKFIEQKKIRIHLNDVEVLPWNPFLLNLDPKPEMGHTEILDKNVEVTYYVLPHMSRISHEDYQKSGGPLGWFQQQGFYIYRGDRLLVAADWLNIEKKREYSKLARISINFPNSSDFDWNLDIKKSTATPPISIRKDLLRIAKIACMKSAKIYNWRGQKSSVLANDNLPLEHLWYDTKNSEGIKKYKINRSHSLIKETLKGSEDNSKLFLKALKLIEEYIPLELIFYNQNENPSSHELEKINEIPDDALINLAMELFKMNVLQGVPNELAKQQIMNSVPFNMFPLINEYLK